MAASPRYLPFLSRNAGPFGLIQAPLPGRRCQEAGCRAAGKRTHLDDNDAGARVEYANFAKSTGMLDALHHFRARTWRQLLALEADLLPQTPGAGRFGLTRVPRSPE